MVIVHLNDSTTNSSLETPSFTKPATIKHSFVAHDQSNDPNNATVTCLYGFEEHALHQQYGAGDVVQRHHSQPRERTNYWHEGMDIHVAETMRMIEPLARGDTLGMIVRQTRTV